MSEKRTPIRKALDMRNFEAMRAELTTLRAENERLREALEDVRVRIFKTDIDSDPWVIQSKIDAALQAGENDG